MAKWKTVRVKQDLLTAVVRTIEGGRYDSLSDFVSEALRLRLDELRAARGQAEAVEEQVEYPVVRERLLCSPEHTWAMVTPDGSIRVGLSDYAQTHLQGISSVFTKPAGVGVEKGACFGSVETWMFRFDLKAPVSGKIAKVNGALQERPSLINEDPYGTGWIVEIKPDEVVTLEDELRELMGPRQYRVYAVKQRCKMREK
jgi:glycine cleavage system H protein